MRSQFQFFMTTEDEPEFVSIAEEMSDDIYRRSNFLWFLRVGDCPIQLLRSRVQDGELISGRIAIATTGPKTTTYKSAIEGERAYKRLRNWMKKSYSNEMTCRNVRIENSETDIKTMWASQRVIELMQSDSPPALKQRPGGFVVFELRNRAEQADAPKP